jgi:DNA-binding SARP family transcriptional activator/ABC-type branched-subunit amino acid transport system substrate-binding protein
VEFRILGPLDVIEDGVPVALGSYNQRALLALLLLHRGDALSIDRLTDELWGDQPPATATKSIQVYVSQLRKPLGADLIETRGRGYALRIEPEQIDAVRFERLLLRGQECLAAGDARLAAQALREGLALWREAPLADFAYEPFAQAEIARLEDLRLAAIEERIDADVALGRHAELVPELEALVRRHPLRERLRGQLMLTLYHSGRQAEALEGYADARRALVDELGIEPGPALRELQRGILAQDPELSAPRRPVALRMRRRRKGGLLIALGGAALLAAAAAAAVVALTGGAGAPAVGAVRPLDASFCSPMHYRPGAPPRFLVASDQELQGPEGALGNQMASAVEYVMRANSFKAGRYAVAYQACDDSTRTEGGAGTAKCSANATAYADNASVIGIVGPTLSACAAVQLPIANRGKSGPLPMVSPSNTRVGLTRAGLGADAGEPARYFPTGIRNYVRIIPADDFQSAADAVLARRLGLAKVFVLSRSESAGVADAFRSAAAKLGVDIAGAAEWSGDTTGYRELARHVRRSGADGVFVAGPISDGGSELIGALRAALGERVRLLASDGFAVEGLLKASGRAVEGVTVSVAGIAPEALEGRGRRFVSRLEQALGETPHQFSVNAAQATQLLLDAIGRSDGTRRSVIRELFASRVRHGILGDFDVTESGDSTANQVTIYQVSGGRLRLDRVITPSLSLVVRS